MRTLLLRFRHAFSVAFLRLLVVLAVVAFSHKAAAAGSYAVWATGSNSSGQFGNGTTTSSTTPVQVLSGVASVSAGDNYGNSHSLYLKTDGTLWAMGWNAYGQLGDGTTTNRITPVQVASGVASVSAGGIYSLYVKTDGTLWATG